MARFILPFFCVVSTAIISFVIGYGLGGVQKKRFNKISEDLHFWMVRVYKYDQILTEIVSFFNDRMKETQGLIKMFSEKEDLRSMEYYTGQLRAFCQGFYFVNYKRGPKKDLWSKEDKGTNHDC